ncbi:MAG: family 78 glycoside hydrolase catalytic domain [Bacteroidetes bacterium]|jgi:alpha-L-rhamnosidase|nr:family 78 glycoside hydrolase catalytic domain [Bacteroidota bacterium]
MTYGWALVSAVVVWAGLGVWGHAQATSGEAALSVTALRTAHTSTPLGIAVDHPCLSWTMAAASRGAMQTAYRIQVAETRQALAAGDNLVWDSGKVSSDRSLHNAYEGPSLAAQQRYYWRVRVWDQEDEAGTWSAPSWWETGLRGPAAWEAQWIEPQGGEGASTPSPSPMLRSGFEVSGPVQSARLYVTSHGLYEMHLNGQRVGDALFTPGWTSYNHRLQYQTFDVTDQLVVGGNAIGAILGDGWYRGYIGFQGQRAYYGDDLALLAQLHVTYQDGRSEIVVRTQEGWTASTGPIRMSDLYMGETYDARLEKPGWTEPGYDDSDWAGVRAVAHSKDVLVASSAPLVKRIQEIQPVGVIYTPEGDTVLDMGQNMVGWMRMEVEGAAGMEVTLRHAEVLDKDGNLYTDNLRSADQTTRYTLRGAGEETYEPHFTFQGFRYVAVSGYPGAVEPDRFTGVVIHSDMTPTGHFQSSHPLVNQLQHNIVWGMKGNFLDIPTDCPQRDERLGWTGDIQVFARTAGFNMHTAGFLKKWLRDLEAEQKPNGSVPHVVPNVLGEGAYGAAGWADASVIVPWTMYQAYGQRRVLAQQYESMKGWVEFMRQRAQMDSTTYVWNNNFTFGDWLAFSTDRPDYPGATTDKDLISTAFFAHSAHLVAQAARTLGREDEARAYQQLFEQVRRAFQAEFVTPRGRLTSGTQTSYVLALSFDLLSPEMRPVAARRLAADVRARSHLTTGFLGTPDLMHTLSAHGFWDEAYDLLLRTEYPSWLYPVTMGATTIWERWDGVKPDSTFQDPGMNSFNHYAYGAIGQWLYEEVAGIQATAPGYNTMRIAPHPGGGLSHARAFLDAGYGRIESDWTRTDKRFQLTVEVPANTQATVRLPGATIEAVTERGATLANANGVSDPRQEGRDVVVNVGAGRYVFAYPTDQLGPVGGGGLDASTAVGSLLANEAARSVLQEHLPEWLDDVPLEQATDRSLREVAPYAPDQLTETVLASIERDLRQIEEVPPQRLSAETKLGRLLADPNARAVLQEQLPELMDSPWLSQAMGFPLTRANAVTPVAISVSALEAVDEALQQIGP